MTKNDKRKFQLNTDAASIVLFIATLLWMAFIFYMSSQTGDDSSFLSNSFSEVLVKFADSIFGENTPPKLLELFQNKFILRKAGHVFEYLVLGILVYSWIRRQGLRGGTQKAGTQKALGGTQKAETQEALGGTQKAETQEALGGTQKTQGTQVLKGFVEAQEVRGTQAPRGFEEPREAQATQEVRDSGDGTISDSGDGTILSQEMNVRCDSGDPPGLPPETTRRTIPLLQSATVKKVMIAILICVIYAATDELHQMLVPGRGPMIADTLLDSVSSAAGVLLIWAIARDWRIDLMR